MGSTFLYRLEAAALITEQRFHLVPHCHDDVPRYYAVLLAEPYKDALVMGYYPKGTLFVPINQSRNETEGKTYNLVIRFDGAVGWLVSDTVVLGKR